MGNAGTSRIDRYQRGQDLWKKKNSRGQILIRMFSRIHPNLPIESANKNTQNSEMNSACFCLHFSSLKNGRKNGIINSERIIPTEDLPCHTTKRRGMRFRRTMKHTILPEVSLPSMKKRYARTTKEIAEMFIQPRDFLQSGAVFCLQSISNVTAHKNGGIDIKVRSL